MSRMQIMVLCLLATGAVFAFDGNQDEVARELKLLEDEVAHANKECIKLEHDAVYTNATCKVVYAEIKKLEKQLVERKKILSEKLDNVPEIHQARAERNRAYSKLIAFKKMNGLVARKEAE